ncbi:MAG: SLC13 family permease, partial [Longimicrobiales bacterium]|nr:SLC13 family permease [Longimicrobiales bacterium]
MTFAAALTLIVLGLVLLGLMLEVLAPDFVLMAGLGVLIVGGVVDLQTALGGFANPTLLAIGSLYVVAEALRKSGALKRAGELLLGGTRQMRVALLRLTSTSAVASAFLNNTPIVAMGIPVVLSWTREQEDVTPSKFLIPLSYASIFGGLCTLIGTSTNLVADGLLRSGGHEGLGFFELARVGLPVGIVGIGLLVVVVPRYLPERSELHRRREEEGITRWSRGQADYVYRVPAGCEIVGLEIQDAKLDSEDLELVRISRESALLAPVSADETLEEGDYLTFRGDADAMERVAERCDLRSADPGHDLQGPFQLREAVLQEGSPLAGERVKDVNFPDRYGALVTGVFRHGSAVRKEPRDILLRPGDTLLLETTGGFARAYASSQDFYLVGGDPEGELDSFIFWKPTRAKWGVAVLAAVIGLVVFDLVHISVAALGGATVMVATGFLTPGEARNAVDWTVLIVIGAALGIGSAMESSGAADLIGNGIVTLAEPYGPMIVLAAILFACSILTELITNNAAVALLFPVAISVAGSLEVDPRPFVIAVTVAASMSFATPLGYQT